MKRKFLYCLLTIMLVSLCTSYTAYAADSIQLKKSSINLGIGESVDITKLITDDDEKSVTYSFKTESKKIASISDSGTVKGKGEGKTTITIKRGSQKANLEVKVKDGAESVTLSQTDITIGVGETVDLDSHTHNGYAYSRSYSSANDAVAGVKRGGIVKGASVGKTKIKVTTYNNKSAVCTVTVKKAPKSIKITNKNKVIQKGTSSHKIKIKLSSKSASYKIKFKSSNTNVAKIDSKGYVTANKNGKAVITVKTYNGVTAKQEITVKNDSLSMNRESTQIALDNENVKKIKYGKSVQGRNLEAFEITNGGKYKKTLFIDFAIHGFEDDYKRDGKVLVNEANALIKYFSKHTDLLKNYRLIIVPCANPDGTLAGKNNLRACGSAFGRCTYKHVDMNRDFNKFKGKETRALRDLILECDPNIYLNMHGWLNETLGTDKLCKIVNSQLKLSKRMSGVYGTSSGYAIGWVHEKLSIPTCLVEYKSPNSVSTSKDINMIKKIIKEY